MTLASALKVMSLSAETARAIMASPSFVLRSVLHGQALQVPAAPGARLRIEQDLVSLANDVYANPLYARDVAWTPEERAAGHRVAVEMIALANRLAHGLNKAMAHVGEVHTWQDGKNHRKTMDGWVEVPGGKPRFHILDNETEDELSMGEGTGAKALTLDEAVAEREKYGTPIVVAYGMGVDSTAMLVGMHQRGIRPDKILFADTGGEKPETYAYRAYMDAWLAKHDFPPVTVLKQKPTTNDRGTYATLEENCLINNTLPSLAFGGRSCSQKWKHAPQHAFLRKDEAAIEAWAKGRKLTKLIGYDAGPIDARRPHIGDDEHYRYAYPLREWGWDREESQRQIAAAGLPVPPKSACFFCPSSKPQELRELGTDLLRRIVLMEAGAEGRQLERIKNGQKAIEGLWRAPVAGNRGATARPGSMTEFIVGEGLVPELAGQAEPWWNQQVAKVVDTGAPDLFGYTPTKAAKKKVPVKARFPVETMAGLLQKALSALGGSLSKALPSRAVKPPRGYTPIPNSKHNGFHKRVNGKWVTWYPGHMERPHPTERFTHEEHEENHAKYQLLLPEAKRKPEYRGGGGAFFRDAKIGARVSIPNGTGKVVDINHNGTIKVQLDTGEDVNVYTNRVDAEPDKYTISREASADMSWSDLYAMSKVDAKSPSLVDAVREKAKRNGRNATDTEQQYMAVLGSMTGNDLIWLSNHPAGGAKDGPDTESVVPKSTDPWASIWAWSKTRDASTDRKAIQMLKRKAAVQGRQGVDDHAQMYMDNLGAIFDVDLSEVAKDAASEHKLKKKAREPVWVARDPGDASHPSARAMIAPGDRFIAPSGRVIEAPKNLTHRKLGAWLIDEANKDLAFRQSERPDSPHEWLSNESRQIDFDSTSIQGLNPKKLSQSDFDTLNMLVFGDEMGPTEGQRAVPVPKGAPIGKARTGPYLGPKGGLWADPQHTVHWDPAIHGPVLQQRVEHAELARRHAQSSTPEEEAEIAAMMSKPVRWDDFNTPEGWGSSWYRAQMEGDIRARIQKDRERTKVNFASERSIKELLEIARRRDQLKKYHSDTTSIERDFRNAYVGYLVDQHALRGDSYRQAEAHGLVFRPNSKTLLPTFAVRDMSGKASFSEPDRVALDKKYEYVKGLWDGGVSAVDIVGKFVSGEADREIVAAVTAHLEKLRTARADEAPRAANIEQDAQRRSQQDVVDHAPPPQVLQETPPPVSVPVLPQSDVSWVEPGEGLATTSPGLEQRIRARAAAKRRSSAQQNDKFRASSGYREGVFGGKPLPRDLLARHGLGPVGADGAPGANHVLAEKHGIAYSEAPASTEFSPSFYVTGNTYKHRQHIKDSVSRGTNPWREASKAWEMSPTELVSALRRIDQSSLAKGQPLTVAFATLFPSAFDAPEPLDCEAGFRPLSNAEYWLHDRGCDEFVSRPATNADAWSRPQEPMVREANGAAGDLGVDQDKDDWRITNYLGEMVLAMGLFKAKYIKKLPTGRRDHPWRYYYKQPVKREPRPHPQYTFSDHDLGPQTWQDHFTAHPDEGGVPHDDRLPLHDKLIHEVMYRPGLDGNPPDTRPRAIPTAILMMGAPGAGKSTILAGLRQRSDVVMIDPDEFKQKLPEYQEAIKDPSRMPLSAAHKVHYESSYIARRARDEAVAGRRNMMVDGTGRNAAAMIELCDRLRSTGYRVHLVFVHVSLEDSLSRIESRKNETGRHVPKSAAIECCEVVPHSFDKVKGHVDSFDAWTTSATPHNRLTFDNGPRAEIKRDANTKKLLSKRMGGPERVHDPVLVEKYLKEPLAYPPSLAD